MGELKIAEEFETGFKDGEDGGGEGYMNINIVEVENGYILRDFDEVEGEESVYVFNDVISLMHHLHEIFGIE